MQRPKRPLSDRRPPARPAPNNGTGPGPGAGDLAARVEVRPDPAAPKANALPILCRLLRKLVEHDERAAVAVKEGSQGGG